MMEKKTDRKLSELSIANNNVYNREKKHIGVRDKTRFVIPFLHLDQHCHCYLENQQKNFNIK
jgi:hypothetical protein